MQPAINPDANKTKQQQPQQSTMNPQLSLDCDDDTSAGLESFGRQLEAALAVTASLVPSLANTADLSDKGLSAVDSRDG